MRLFISAYTPSLRFVSLEKFLAQTMKKQRYKSLQKHENSRSHYKNIWHLAPFPCRRLLENLPTLSWQHSHHVIVFVKPTVKLLYIIMVRKEQLMVKGGMLSRRKTSSDMFSMFNIDPNHFIDQLVINMELGFQLRLPRAWLRISLVTVLLGCSLELLFQEGLQVTTASLNSKEICQMFFYWHLVFSCM